MADDDNDDVAIDGVDEGGGNDAVAAGGPIAATIAVRSGTRPVSDKVRAAFAASMEKAKARSQAADEDEGVLEPVEHAELPADGAATQAAAQEAPVAATPAVVAAPELVALAPVTAAPAQPPAPSLDPEVIRLRGEFETRKAELDKREQQLADAHRATDIAKLRDTYYDKGAPAVAEVIKQWMPGISDEDMKNEIADLIQDLAHQYLDAPLEQSVKDRIATKRTRAGLKAWRSDQDRIEEDRQKKLLASQEEENRARVRRILHQEVTKPDHASQFPWLSSESNAGDLVFETIDQEYRTTGTQLTWQDAAKRVDDWLKSQSFAFYDKRKHLLSPPAPQQPAEKQRPQGDNQVSRSQAQPKPPAPQPERPVANGKWTPESHRESIKRKFRGSFRATDE